MLARPRVALGIAAVCFPLLALRVLPQEGPVPRRYGPQATLDVMVRATGLIERGQTLPRDAMLAALGVDLARLEERRERRVMHVAFITWRLSADFDLCWMMDAREDDGPDAPCYGLRVVHRETGKVVARSWTDPDELHPPR